MISKGIAKFTSNMTSHASRKISAPGEVFEFYMDYTKRPLTLQKQVEKLINRGYWKFLDV